MSLIDSPCPSNVSTSSSRGVSTSSSPSRITPESITDTSLFSSRADSSPEGIRLVTTMKVGASPGPSAGTIRTHENCWCPCHTVRISRGRPSCLTDRNTPSRSSIHAFGNPSWSSRIPRTRSGARSLKKMRIVSALRNRIVPCSSRMLTETPGSEVMVSHSIAGAALGIPSSDEGTAGGVKVVGGGPLWVMPPS